MPDSDDRKARISALLEKAERHFNNQNYDEAIRCCTEIIHITDDIEKKALVLNNRGLAYTKKSDYEKAIADFNEAIKLKPDDHTVFYNRGLAYAEKGDYEKAIADYNEAIKLKPDDHTAFNNRGLAYAEKGDYEKAIADYNEAIKLKPDDHTAFNNRGLAYAKKSDYEKAIADYNEAIKLKPDYVNAHNNRGLAYAKKSDYEKAIADFNEAIKLKPDYVNAHNNRGLAYTKKSDYEKAIADFNEAIKLKPDNHTVFYNRGLTYAEKGDYEKAIADFNEVIKLKPDDHTVFYSRGLAYAEKGDYEKAIADFNEAIKLKPDYVNAHHNRAISMAKKDAEETQKKYEEKIEEILGPIKSLAYHTEEINEREEEYKKELAELDELISSCTSDITKLILTSLILIVLTGYHLLDVTKIQSPFTITAIVFAALAIALPLLWYLRNLFERRRVLQICIEDYWRKRMLTGFVVLMENSDMKQYLVIETHRHFMNNSTADLLSDLLAPRNSKKTQHKEMEPLDMDEFTKIIKQVVNRENK